MRKDRALHLLVEALGYFQGKIGGTPDHGELYQRIGDEMRFACDAWDKVTHCRDEHHPRLLPAVGQ